MKFTLTAAVICAAAIAASGQHISEPGKSEQADTAKTAKSADTFSSLGSFMRSGSFQFEARTFAMGTVNKGNLLDYHTLATGGGIGYYSPRWRGLHFGISGFFVFQVYEHNIRIADPSTGNGNRYEILLYDMNDLDNTSDLDRMEDFYLAWDRGGFSAVAGRQRIHTPLLNEQDNRMRHNSFNGITLRYKKNGWTAMGGFYSALTMRGTVNWYSAEESFGVYPFGRNPLGTPSEYAGNIRSRGIGVAGVTKQSERLRLQAWNYTAENVFNMLQIQAEGDAGAGNVKLLYGLQGFWQTPLNKGGNPELTKAYIDPDSPAYAAGAKVGAGNQRKRLTLNALRIHDSGRLLFPREWGREEFFVSLPRERHEGNGDVWSVMLRYEDEVSESFRYMIGAASVRNPSTDSFALNKYGIPSYYHFAGTAEYAFGGYLKGLHIMAIIANKTAARPEKVDDAERINRVDLWNFSLVGNYRF